MSRLIQYLHRLVIDDTREIIDGTNHRVINVLVDRSASATSSSSEHLMDRRGRGDDVYLPLAAGSLDMNSLA